MLDLYTTGSRLWARRHSIRGLRPTLLSAELGFLFPPVSGFVSQHVFELAARFARSGYAARGPND